MRRITEAPSRADSDLGCRAQEYEYGEGLHNDPEVACGFGDEAVLTEGVLKPSEPKVRLS